MITRFAPTPSGFLHEGNAVNALLVSWLASHLDGDVALRIDDLDAARLRPGYVDDIFTTLAWLDVPWSIGPRDPQELAARSADPQRIDTYRQALARAGEAGLQVYACRCTRRMLTGPAVGGCPGACRTAGLEHTVDQTVLRAHIPLGTRLVVDGLEIDVAQSAGDVVLWRRDDLPAYHLASIIDDHHLGVTHIVRGVDLRESTALQRFLAPYLGAPDIAEATYLHHGLVTGPDGAKLSKSQQGRGTPLPHTEDERARITARAVELGASIGIVPR